MKAYYSNKIKQQDNLYTGMQFGLNIATLAFHNVCGIGKKRIKRVEAECQRLVNEIVSVGDVTWTNKKLQEALNQIK